MIFEKIVEINPKVTLKKGEEYSYIPMEDVKPGNRYAKATKFKIYKNGGARFLNGDILFARITPCLENGKIAQAKNLKNNLGFGSTEFFIFRGKEKISVTSYIYYLCLTNKVRKTAEKSMSGASGRQRADIDSIKSIEIKIPDLPTQQKIASILSAYDDLIENNTRRIKKLEEIAQAIYKEWFVKFKFPGHDKVKFVDSELGRIPEGWEVVNIEGVSNCLGGGTPSTKKPEYWNKGEISWFTPSDLTQNSSLYIIDSGKKINSLGLKKSSAKLFPAKTIMMTSRATIGYFGITNKEACTNQGFINIIPNEEFLRYYLLFNLINRKDEIINNANGSTYKEIIKSRFRKMKIIVPSKSIVFNFHKITESIINEIRILTIKNQNLHKTRDLLLPKLMNGEVEV